MSLLTTLQAARRGLQVSSEGINIVGHNTANATNENYARRTQAISTMHPLHRNGQWLGQGARTEFFRRHVDVMLEQQLVHTHGKHSRSKQAYESTRMLEARLADGSAGSILDSYNSFMGSLRQMRDDPSDIVFRDQVLLEAERFTESVRTTTDFFVDNITNIRNSIEGSIDDINDKIRSIAEFNKRIRHYGSTMAANDLMDQRDAVVKELSQLVGVHVHHRDDGQSTIYVHNHAVVQEGNFRLLSYSEDSNKKPTISISGDSANIDVSDGLEGLLKGKLDAYDVASGFVNDMNTFVDAFATQFNSIHSSGNALGQASSSGIDFFEFNALSPATSFRVNANVLDDVTLLSAALTDEVGDSDNLTQLIELDNTDSLISTSYSPTQFLSKIFADVGSAVNKASRDYEIQDLRLNDMNELRNSISGVDLDSEAARLIEYQASYEAASKVISVTNQMLQELMNIV